MLVYALLGLLAAGLSLVAFWYAQTRNVEIAPYDVIETDGDIELRAYPALVVAEVSRAGSRDEAVRSGFGPLARYIFAKERNGAKIAMTAPVTQTTEGGRWTVRFVMPAGSTLDTLPKPAASSGVRLGQLSPGHFAVIRFSGWWRDDLFTQKNAALLDWLARRGLKPSGEPVFAYYNDPFTPGFLRRNEILYALQP